MEIVKKTNKEFYHLCESGPVWIRIHFPFSLFSLLDSDQHIECGSESRREK